MLEGEITYDELQKKLDDCIQQHRHYPIDQFIQKLLPEFELPKNAQIHLTVEDVKKFVAESIDIINASLQREDFDQDVTEITGVDCLSWFSSILLENPGERIRI